MKRLGPYKKLGLGTGLTLILLLIGYRFGGSGISSKMSGGTISVSDAETCLRAGGNIFFNVTFGTETYLQKVGLWEEAKAKENWAQPFVFNASTHVGTIRDLSLNNNVFVAVDGTRYPAISRPIASTTHHNTYLIFLPRFDHDGRPIFEQDQGYFEIIIENIDIPAKRIFKFNLPLPTSGRETMDVTQLLMLIGSAMAAMLLTCTPCLIGSLTVGSITMGTSWKSNIESTKQQIRTEMTKRTLYYLAALVACYTAVAIAASTFDVNVEEIRPVEIIGGVLLIIVGLGLLRSWQPIIYLENKVVKLIVRKFPTIGQFTTTETPVPTLNSSSSSAMGASLAMVCSVAGAPTLTTAIIFPVMIYAGLNDIYWSLIILLAYLIVAAIPFLLIASGLGEALLNISIRLRHRLLVANAILLVGLGTMLLVSPEEVANVLSIPARLIIEPMSWLF